MGEYKVRVFPIIDRLCFYISFTRTNAYRFCINTLVNFTLRLHSGVDTYGIIPTNEERGKQKSIN